MALLRLIRWQNLVIIFLAQFFAWMFVIMPASGWGNSGQPILLHTPLFILIALSTVLIAAAGYIINDYFDIKIDAINRPEKMVLGRQIPVRSGIVLHFVLNALGLALSAFVAMRGGHYEWLLLQAACILLLWFYSTSLKRQYMSGNIAVAFLTALAVIVLLVYEPAMHFTAGKKMLPDGAGGQSSLPSWILVAYAYFAFMLTWAREIVKDMEDLKGDEAEGCVTMPIVKGLRYAATFAAVIASFTVLPLCYGTWVLYSNGYVLLPVYIFVLLVLPLVLWIVWLGRGHTSEHYHAASQWLKIIMVLGIGSLLIYNLNIYFQSVK